MTSGLKTVIYPVRDLAQEKTLYGRLFGVAPAMDEPYHVGFNVGDQDVGLDPHGHSKGMTESITYWHVDDIEQRLALLLDAGAEAHQAITDVGGGKLIASVEDADGNITGLLQPA
ncbi:MAG: VOC family protein [Thermomicrobiales bacterium]